MSGMLLVVSGPSGAGKSTVIRHMLSENLLPCPHMFSVSMTTREPRPGEINGVHYTFVTRARFEESIAQNQLLEYAKYADEYYGTPIEPIRRCVEQGDCAILDIEVQGMQQVVERWPDCVTVFIAPPGMDELEKRLRERKTESDERILKRLKLARLECEHIREYQYLIINGNVPSAAIDLASVIRAESLKTERQTHIL